MKLFLVFSVWFVMCPMLSFTQVELNAANDSQKEGFVVEVFQDDKLFCKGILIDLQWVIIPAHVFNGGDLDDIGLTISTKSNQKIQVKQIFMNNNYSFENKIADLCLLYLTESIMLNGVDSVKPTTNFKISDESLTKNKLHREHKFLFREMGNKTVLSSFEKEKLRYAPLLDGASKALIGIPAYAMKKEDGLYVYYTPISRYTEWIAAVMNSMK